MELRVKDACPVNRADGQLCTPERGHEGPHYGDVWKKRQIVGVVYWDDNGNDVVPAGAR